VSRKPSQKVAKDASPEIQALVANRGKPLASASPLFVWSDHYSLNGKIFPIAGANAEIVVAGQVSSRITATRLVTVGVFALAAKKKTDKRDFALLITGNTWDGKPHGGNTFRFPPGSEVKIRKIAALINQLSAQARPSAPPPTPSQEVTAGSNVEDLTRLADLHTSGALTDDEFSAAKAKLLN
jgi:hypothetical protein